LYDDSAPLIASYNFAEPIVVVFTSEFSECSGAVIRYPFIQSFHHIDGSIIWAEARCSFCCHLTIVSFGPDARDIIWFLIWGWSAQRIYFEGAIFWECLTTLNNRVILGDGVGYEACPEGLSGSMLITLISAPSLGRRRQPE
jgi:hypothetical protein